MKKRTVKVNVANIPEEYRSLVKEEMTYQDMSLFGTILLKNKLSNLKNKICFWRCKHGKIKKKKKN